MSNRWIDEVSRILAAEPATRRVLARTIITGLAAGLLTVLNVRVTAGQCLLRGEPCRGRC